MLEARGSAYEIIATFAQFCACAQNSMGICFDGLRLHECRGKGASARFSETGEIPMRGISLISHCRDTLPTPSQLSVSLSKLVLGVVR